MDAIQLLIDQHRMLEERLDAAVAASDPRERAALTAEAGDQLAVHLAAEEDLFYPAVRAHRVEEILHGSLREHRALKQLVTDLLHRAADDPDYGAKLLVLREQTEHHHCEEEERLFPGVRRCIDPPEREALGRAMLACQKRLLRAGQPREALHQPEGAAAL